MNAAAFDTCAAAKRLRDAGFDEDQAEAAVSMVRDAIGSDRDQLATKADLEQLRIATKADLEQLRIATKADLANAVNRMLIAQIAVGGLIVALVKLL